MSHLSRFLPRLFTRIGKGGRSCFGSFVLLAVVLFVGTLAAQQRQPVVMISIDGLRPDAVLRADTYGLRVPNLRRFVTGGAYAKGVVGVVPTLTYPSHTTLVTGVAPATHGILSNTTFDPLFRNQVGWYWYGEQERAPTLWSAAHAAGIVTASVNWPVTVDAPGLDYDLPEYWRTSMPDDLLLCRALARPLGLQQALEASDGPWVDGNTTTIEADQTRTRFILTLLGQKHPGLLTVHLSALDEAEHLSAPFSAESNRTLEVLDGMIGQIQAAALALDPHAVVAVVSDHGFARTDHRVNLYAPFVAAGLLSTAPGGATLISWKATLWPAGGSAALMLHDPADIASREAALKLLRDLAADPANGIARIIPRQQLAALHGFTGAEALVVLSPGYQLGYNFSGPLVTPAPSTGMHGYLPSEPDMQSSFFLMGSGIAAGQNLGVIDMRSIAPTLAHFLGIPFPSAETPAVPLR